MKTYKTLKTLNIYDLNGSVNSVIERLNSLKKEFGDDISLDFEVDHFHKESVIYVQRLETDEEEAIRKATEEEKVRLRREANEMQRRLQYGRLKKEFENEQSK